MPSNTALMEEIDKGRKRERSIKARVAAKSEEITGYAGTVAGGGIGGYIDAKWPKRKLLSVGLPTALGVTGLAVGICEWAGRASHFVGGVGAGLLGAEAYKLVYDKTAKSTTAGEVGAGRGGGGALPARDPVTLDQMRAQLADVMRAGR